MFTSTIIALVIAANAALNPPTAPAYSTQQIEAIADCRSVVSGVLREGNYTPDPLVVQYLGREDDVRTDRLFTGMERGESPLVTVTAICGRGW